MLLVPRKELKDEWRKHWRKWEKLPTKKTSFSSIFLQNYLLYKWPKENTFVFNSNSHELWLNVWPWKPATFKQYTINSLQTYTSNGQHLKQFELQKGGIRNKGVKLNPSQVSHAFKHDQSKRRPCDLEKWK